MPVLPSVQTAVEKTVAAANTKVFGVDLLKNDPESLLLIAVIKAFQGEQSRIIYVSEDGGEGETITSVLYPTPI